MTLALDWQDSAACAEMDPALFFPAPGHPAREAKAACASCPVRDACLEFALATDQMFGIFGGMTPPERAREASRRRRVARRPA